jgi:hypothetical protein
MERMVYLAWIGSAISMVGTARYIIGIVKDGTQPRLASWIAWFVANAGMTAMAVLTNSHMAIFFNALAAAGNLAVLVISGARRVGEKPDGGADWVCLATAGVCTTIIIVCPHWSVVGSLLAMAANLTATWPTASHAWKQPFAETWQLFAANAGASLLGLLGVAAGGGMQITTIAGPLVAMCGNLALTGITLGRRFRREISTEIDTIRSEVAVGVAEIEDEVAGLEELLGEEIATVAVAAANIQRPARKRTGLIGARAGA